MGPNAVRNALLALSATLLATVSSCTPKFTAFETKVPGRMTHSNRKALERIVRADALRASGAAMAGTRPFKVAILTDTHADYEDFTATVKLVNARNDVDFALLLGDFTNVGMIWEYEQAWRIMSGLRVPLVVLQGNHDAVGFGKDIYNDMFGVRDFVFRYGGVRFVAWANSKLEYEISAHRFDALQGMLRDGGGGPPGERTMVLAHIPPTESETQIYSVEEKNRFHALLEENGVRIALHGHRHAHGWQRVREVDYFTAERVRGVNFTVMAVSPSGQTFEQCGSGGCVPLSRPSRVATRWEE